MANLATNYMGLSLKNPIIIGSCGLTNSIENIKLMEKAGAGAVVIKSLFEEQIKAEIDKYIASADSKIEPFQNTFNNVINKNLYDYEEAYNYIYDFAKRHTLDEYLQFISKLKKEVNIPIIASINCVTGYDWQFFAKRIEDAGADALELNVYLLPSNFEKEGTTNEQIYFSIINEVKKYVKIPVALKLGFYLSGLSNTILKLSETGIKGMVLFNRPYNPDINIEKMELTASHIQSSAFEYAHTLRWIAILAGRIKCDLAATTGIHDSETIIKQVLAGANAVQVVSALYKNGYDTITTMLNGVETWMNKHQFNTIADFRGRMSMQNVENPASYERVQFMKLYSGIE